MKKGKIIWVYLGLMAVLFGVGLYTFKVRWRVCETCGLQRYERRAFGVTLKGYAEGTIDPRGPFDHQGFDPDRRAYAYRELHGECVHDWRDRHAGIFGRDPDFEPARVPLPYPPPPEIVAWLDIHLRGMDPPDASTDTDAVATPLTLPTATFDSPTATADDTQATTP